MRGRDVVVLTRTVTYDEHSEKVEAWEPETVHNVLVAPGSTTKELDVDRPDGIKVDATAGFPKTFSKRLKGCRVQVDDRLFGVIGDPMPNMAENCPTDWWYTAQLEYIDG